MKRIKTDYRLITENDELRRRVERLEQKMEHLQNQNMEMYKVLKSKNSFLDFKFYDEFKETQRFEQEERATAEPRNVNLLNLFRRNLSKQP